MTAYFFHEEIAGLPVIFKNPFDWFNPAHTHFNVQTPHHPPFPPLPPTSCNASSPSFPLTTDPLSYLHANEITVSPVHFTLQAFTVLCFDSYIKSLKDMQHVVKRLKPQCMEANSHYKNKCLK